METETVFQMLAILPQYGDNKLNSNTFFLLLLLSLLPFSFESSVHLLKSFLVIAMDLDTCFVWKYNVGICRKALCLAIAQ